MTLDKGQFIRGGGGEQRGQVIGPHLGIPSVHRLGDLEPPDVVVFLGRLELLGRLDGGGHQLDKGVDILAHLVQELQLVVCAEQECLDGRVGDHHATGLPSPLGRGFRRGGRGFDCLGHYIPLSWELFLGPVPRMGLSKS